MIHRRRVKGKSKRLGFTKREAKHQGLQIIDKGGYTIATIRLADGTEVTAFARCRNDEVFRPQMGYAIAVGRSLKAALDVLHNQGKDESLLARGG